LDFLDKKRSTGYNARNAFVQSGCNAVIANAASARLSPVRQSLHGQRSLTGPPDILPEPYFYYRDFGQIGLIYQILAKHLSPLGKNG
jgi:hypothetical protein